TERLNTLTNNILISSQLESEGHTISKEDLDLGDLFKDCVRNFMNRFPERRFIESINPDIDVKGDPFLLQLLINNLLENAIKYSPKEKPITCGLHQRGGTTELEITDEGHGIPEEEKKNIFKKFYRIGDEATRQSHGTGLGLYLCKKIAEDHNAEIEVKGHLPRGSKFSVIFKPDR